jgi:cellulose synthase operon protein B
VLRPGQNTLTIEARLPAQLDAACESVDKASSAVRLFINDNSYLEVPQYARVGRYPDIAVLTSGLTANRDGAPDPLTYVFVPSYEKQSMNAAATFMAKMAFSSDRVKKIEFTSTLPDLDTANVIAFGSYDTLPSELTTRMKLDFVNIRSAKSNRVPVEVASLDGAAVDLAGTAGDQNAAKEQSSRLARFAGNLASDPIGAAWGLVEGAKSRTLGEMQKLNLKYLPSLLEEGRDDTYSPSISAALIVAQASSDNGGVWTVFAARNSDVIQSQADVLTDYNVWNKLGGAVQSLTDTGEVIDRRESPNQYLFETQPLTFANARLIAAGWLANNAEIYIGALLAAAIMLGIGTFMVLRTGRVRND